MALRFLDSFDHYLGADLTMKWTSQFFGGITSGGLHGSGLTGSVSKGMLFPGNVVIMECYIKGFDHVFHIGDHLGQGQCGLQVTGDGVIKATRFHGSPAGALIAMTGPDLIRANTWYHIGWRVFVDPLGSVEVRLNGATVINETDTDTTATTWSSLLWSGTVGSFGLGSNASGIVFDDLVVMDDVDDGLNDPRLPGGGGFDKFLGPVEILVRRPNAAGLLAEWTPTPAVPNYQNVDDLTPDSDTTYNSADNTAVGDSDLFAMEDLDLTQDVLAVQSLVLARKTEEGVAAAATLVHEGGTTTVGPTVYQPNTYSYMHRAEPTLPDGSLWTRARWNAIQYGYRRIV